MFKKLLNKISNKTSFNANFDGDLIKEILNEKLECNGVTSIYSKCGKHELIIKQNACSLCMTSSKENLPGLFITNPDTVNYFKSVTLRYHVRNNEIARKTINGNWSSVGIMGDSFKEISGNLKIKVTIE